MDEQNKRAHRPLRTPPEPLLGKKARLSKDQEGKGELTLLDTRMALPAYKQYFTEFPQNPQIKYRSISFYKMRQLRFKELK